MTRRNTDTGARIWAAATAAAGLLALLAPRTVSRAASRDGAAPDSAVVRILGARQLLQGVAVFLRPAPLLLGGGVVVDALHAASMVPAALIWPGYRRAAIASATVAGTSAIAGTLILRRRDR